MFQTLEYFPCKIMRIKICWFLFEVSAWLYRDIRMYLLLKWLLTNFRTEFRIHIANSPRFLRFRLYKAKLISYRKLVSRPVRILKHTRIQSEIILDNITTCFGSTLLKILAWSNRIHRFFPHLVSSLLFNCNIGLFICIDSGKPLLLLSKSTCTI